MKGNEPDRKAEMRHTPPALALPKGGGAIKGIGETFTANPVTGTCGVAIPLPLSPGRAGSAFPGKAGGGDREQHPRGHEPRQIAGQRDHHHFGDQV